MNLHLSIIFFLGHLFSQSANNSHLVISNGAIQSESEQIKLVGTVGQAFTNKLEAENTVLISGLWGNFTQISLGVEEVVPEKFSISSAYPNPFNSTVNIDLSIPHETEINIQVFDLLGRIVFLHKQNFTDAGRYKFQWNARNNRGESIPSGIYIVSIQHHKNTHKQKITFLK